MFYLIGIEAIDLFSIKKEQLEGGRLLYTRAKTGTLYSIKVEPEAMEIINKYAGKGEYLLCVRDNYKNYKDFLHRMNENLCNIGEMERQGRGGKKERKPLFAKLTSKWARHTWATIAADIGITFDVVSHSLGHKIGSSVTAIYVKFNRMKVDEANRKVIDYVNGKN
jgi:integrase